MVSRRSFLFGSLSGLVTAFELANPLIAWAKKTPRTPAYSGPHSVSREDWAPAIMPDHVGIIDKGYLCFTDDFGRLAIVDLRKSQPNGEKSSVKILGELNGIGTKVIDFAFSNQTAYGLVYRENENQEPVVYLVIVSLIPNSNPTITSQTIINRLTEGSSISFGNDMICIAGVSSSGENIASIYGAPKRGGEPNYLASLTLQNPVRRVDLQDRQLVILSSANGGNSQIDLVNLSNPTAPNIRSTVPFTGDYRVMARFKDTLLVAGLGGFTEPGGAGKISCMVKAFFLGGNNQSAASLQVPELTSVVSAATSARGDQFVLLGDCAGARTLVVLSCDKGRSVRKDQVLKLPSAKGEGSTKGTVVIKENTIYVAAGWSGVTMLSKSKSGVALGPTYSIPRLSAAGVASWGDLVVLAGAQLQLYSIARPERPSLINWADPDAAIKTLVGAGSFILCLSREEITLRKMDKLRDTAATVKLQASQLCFDNSQKTAYAIKILEKTTRVTKIKVYADKMELDKPFELPSIFNRCQAKDGLLLLSGLNEVALYRTAGGASTESAPELIGTRHFDNLAIRDLAIADDAIVATAVDPNCKGFFIVLSKDDKNLNLLGSIDLPSDGVAVAASGNKGIAVGRNHDGKDVASIVTFANKINPQILTTLAVIEGVSSVTIKDQLAVLAGRGLEIVTLG